MSTVLNHASCAQTAKHHTGTELALAAELDLPTSFFAPVQSDKIHALLDGHQKMRTTMETMAGLFQDQHHLSAVHFFQQGSRTNNDPTPPDPVKVFNIEMGLRALDASYWRDAIQLTDIYDIMPSARRDEWNEAISSKTTPAFTAENVWATFEDLFTSRVHFVAERVDNIFRGLSGNHVTNSPGAFRKRMIVNNVFENYCGALARKHDLIDDLRKLIAKFLGYDEPHWSSTDKILRTCRARHGQWHSVDGGALRIRCYLKGTAHLEVHPDMAWRLNAILHTLYPRAIAPKDRKRNKAQAKPIQPIMRPLPQRVIMDLHAMRHITGRSYQLDYTFRADKHVRKETTYILRMLGAVVNEREVHFYYPPEDVLGELFTSGCIPDSVSHQYYPTPPKLALAAVQMIDWPCCRQVLEPSAGTGGLADVVPARADRKVHCIETNKLFVQVLQSKGYHAQQEDFLAVPPNPVFDAVLMNPPFDRGQWRAHVEHALQFLSPHGQLVAILPASQRNTELVPGWVHTWSGVFSNHFANTSMDVAIVRIQSKKEHDLETH